jgi:hypothetical protein
MKLPTLQQEQGAGTKVKNVMIVFCVISLTIGSLFTTVEQGYNFQGLLSSKEKAKRGGTTIRERSRGFQNPEDSNYSWTGNHWIAPHSVPTYTPHEMRAIFQRHNVLWIGDSTCRRAYATMFAMLNASNPLDVTTQEIDHAGIIDVNKRVWKEVCTNRTFSNNTIMTHQNLCRHVPGAKAGYGKFDMVGGACYKNIVGFVDREVEQPLLLEEQYSVIVISLGIWEAIRARDCGMPNTTGAADHLQLALNALQKLSSQSPSLTIMWRTVGFSSNAVQSDKMLVNLNVMAKERMINVTNMRVVDWGTVIHERSYGPKDISGDMAPHYGLEARTLMAQMLTHEVASSEY